MATVGDLLGMAKRSAADFERWLTSADPQLAIAVEQAAERGQLSSAEFIRMAVVDFSQLADGDAWSSLTAQLHGHHDPGLACLTHMVRWRTNAAVCSSHG